MSASAGDGSDPPRPNVVYVMADDRAAGAGEEPSEPGWELYDLRDDPHQLRNVYGDPRYADVRERLRERLFERKAELGDTDDAYPGLLARREQG